MLKGRRAFPRPQRQGLARQRDAAMKNTDELLMRLLVRIGLRGILTCLIEMCGAEAVRTEMASLIEAPGGERPRVHPVAPVAGVTGAAATAATPATPATPAKGFLCDARACARGTFHLVRRLIPSP